MRGEGPGGRLWSSARGPEGGCGTCSQRLGWPLVSVLHRHWPPWWGAEPIKEADLLLPSLHVSSVLGLLEQQSRPRSTHGVQNRPLDSSLSVARSVGATFALPWLTLAGGSRVLAVLAGYPDIDGIVFLVCVLAVALKPGAFLSGNHWRGFAVLALRLAPLDSMSAVALATPLDLILRSRRLLLPEEESGGKVGASVGKLAPSELPGCFEPRPPAGCFVRGRRVRGLRRTCRVMHRQRPRRLPLLRVQFFRAR